MTTLSDTPRSNEADSKWETSDSVVDAFNGAIDLCRQLERELAEANARIKALVEAGDALLMWLGEDTYPSDGQRLQDQWTAAKEGAK